MVTHKIKEEGSKGLQEYIISCSVIIGSKTPGFKKATGVAIEYNGEHFIVTAAHVLKAEPQNENLLIIGRVDSPLQMVKKRDIHGQTKYSTPTPITVIDRLPGNDEEDIAALKLKSPTKELPHTVFHRLSDQGQAELSNGKLVVITGFPTQLERPGQHVLTGQRGVVMSSYHAWQKIMPISTAPKKLDPGVHFITDFIYDQDGCSDPLGMSGGGAWSIPKIHDGQLWYPSQTQLAGIQIGFYREKDLLVLTRIERVLDLLSGLHRSSPA